VEKPRIFLTSLCSDARYQSLLFTALQEAGRSRSPSQEMFGRYSSEMFQYYHLLSEDHQQSIEYLCWFGARLQGFILVVDAETGVTEELRQELLLASQLKLRVAALVIISSEAHDEDWLYMVEEETRKTLDAAQFSADSAACIRWQEGRLTAIQQLYTVLNGFFSSVVPLDLRPLRLELLARRDLKDSVSVTAVYWQGALTHEAELELVGLRPNKRVTLLEAYPKDPIPGSLVRCRLQGVSFEELCLGQVLCHVGTIAARKRCEVRLWQLVKPQAQLPKWLSEKYPESPTDLSFYAAPQITNELPLKSTYSIQIGPLYLNAPGEFTKTSSRFFTGSLSMPRANLIEGQLIWYMRNEKDPLAQHPAVESGATFMLRRGSFYWGIGIFL
jgi:hypothetical protein